jgi:hypothetical protein
MADRQPEIQLAQAEDPEERAARERIRKQEEERERARKRELEEQEAEDRKRDEKRRAEREAEADAHRKLVEETQAEVRKEAEDRERVAAANETEDRRIAAQKKFIAIAWSAVHCGALEDRKNALTEIAAEKKYARQAGVVNLGNLEEQKTKLRETDAEIKNALGWLRRYKAKPLSCTAPGEIALYMTCREAGVLPAYGPFDQDDGCLKEIPQRLMRVVQLITAGEQ